ncbi:DUF6912 family protein, partial [Nocardioides dubius]|uniref:DUF6912 family protein n=1 Tax=Nocardioides dubius TaxID=317019 RepID=UPI003CD07FE8
MHHRGVGRARRPHHRWSHARASRPPQDRKEAEPMSHRVYLPLDLDRLARLVSDRSLPGPLTAHAVTDALIAAWPDGDQEGWEYAALAAAGGD